MARPRSKPSEPTPVIRFPERGPHQGLGSRLSRVSYLWHRAMHAALKPLGVTHDEYLFMVGIARLAREDDPITQVEFAEHAGLDVMITSKVVRRLDKKEWIVRDPHPSDTRA